MKKSMPQTTLLVAVSLFAVGVVGCSSSTAERPTASQGQVFEDERTDNYSMSFSSDFPTDASEATAIASDASGKGPFVVTVACDSGGSMTRGIDDEGKRDVECNGNKVKIEGVQKTAKIGGVKFTVSSEKDDGSWKIQLVGTKN